MVFLQNLISLGIIFGIISMVSWGLSDFVAALLSRKIGSFRTVLWITIFGDLFLFIYLLVTKALFFLPTAAFLLSVAAGFFHAIGGWSFYQGLKVGKVSLVSPISSSWPLIVIFSAIILGERLTSLQSLAIGVIILGNFLASTNLKELLSGLKISLTDPGIPFAFLTTVAWGIGFALLALAAKEANFLLPSFFLFASVIFFLIPFSIVSKQSLKPPTNLKDLIFALFIGVTSILAYITFSLGVKEYLTSLTASLAGSYPVVTVLLGRWILKEKVSLAQTFGISFIISGVIILSS